MLKRADPKPKDSLSYSLWLLPDMESAIPVQATINTLATQFSSLPFAPHMTVCSQLTGRTGELDAKLNAFAKANKAQQLRGNRFFFRKKFYQSLFIELELTENLRRFQQNAVKIFNIDKTAEFYPHISLAYIDPDSFDATSAIAQLDRSLLLERRYDRLLLMETSGKQQSWTKILEARLHD